MSTATSTMRTVAVMNGSTPSVDTASATRTGTVPDSIERPGSGHPASTHRTIGQTLVTLCHLP